MDERLSKFDTHEGRLLYSIGMRDKGCQYWKHCLDCPFPLINNKCLADLTKREREKYLEGVK